MKLSVPYYSQFIDVDDSFWMLRACGATALKMVAEYHLPVGNPNEGGNMVPDIVALCNEARERGGYDMTNGWLHDYLVMKASELGLHAYRKEGLTSLDEIIISLDAGNPVIVSVEKRVLEQTRFHMIVLVGYDRSQTDTEEMQTAVETTTDYRLPATNCTFYYHEPESTDTNRGQYRECSEEVFMKYFRGKAIFITK
jgi:hypothetical protein